MAELWFLDREEIVSCVGAMERSGQLGRRPGIDHFRSTAYTRVVQGLD
jgi:hypothetical protein